MLETSNFLVNKVILPIRKTEGANAQRDLLGILKNFLFQHICGYFHVSLEWKTFSNGGTLGNAECGVSGISSNYSEESGIAQWAMTLNVKDSSFSRRRWKYYIGVNQREPLQMEFYYAKCCYDHMSGSLSSLKPIIAFEDKFIQPLFSLPALQFMCGDRTYISQAIELNTNTYNDFLSHFYDTKRHLPIFLITCPDVVLPQRLLDLMKGNILVWWCSNPNIIETLNEDLADNMYTPWDSVHILMPLLKPDSFHPSYTYEDIQHMGVDNFITGVRQAYSQSMRSEQRVNFPTVESVNFHKLQHYAHILYDQQQEQRNRILELTSTIASQSEELQAAKRHLQDYQKAHPANQIDEYEALLNDSIAEADLLKQGVVELTSRLFSTMGIQFKPNSEQTVSELRELEMAIYSALSCAADRKGN